MRKLSNFFLISSTYTMANIVIYIIVSSTVIFFTCCWTPVNCDINSPSVNNNPPTHRHRHHHQRRHHHHNTNNDRDSLSYNNNQPLLLENLSVQSRLQQDENELVEMESVDTATLLTTSVLPTPPESQQQEKETGIESISISPAVVRVSHEKNHLWKLTVDNQQKENESQQTDFNSTASIIQGTLINNEKNDDNRNFKFSDGNDDDDESQDIDPTRLLKLMEGMEETEENVIIKEKPESSTSSSVDSQIIGCPSCIMNKQLESTLPSMTLRKMRLELIKEQILRKLGLKEAPNTQYIARERLPDPVAQGNILPKIKQPYIRNRDRDTEDFYGKTEQVIVFPEDVLPRCVTHLNSPSSCFTFNLPQDNPADEIYSAELWVYKIADEKDGRNQSLWVYEIPQLDINHNHVKAKFIDAQYDVTVREGWMKLNLTSVTKRWLRSGKLERFLQVGCKTCAMDSTNSPILTSGDQKPFIVINFKSITQKKRKRRSINCSPRVQECCRESFVVDFRDIGWDSWIVQPPTYNAYFCKGSCINLNGLAHSNTKHTSMMQNYIHKYGITNRTAEIVPCCAASKMSAISLMYRDPNNLNTTLKHEILPNMVVDECSCM